MGRSPTRKPKQADMLALIADAKGNISAMARALNVDRSTVYRWLRHSGKLQTALDSQRETVIDTAESALYTAAFSDRELTAIFYILNNHPNAKRRGWGPRQEITGADGGPLEVKGFIGISPDDWDND